MKEEIFDSELKALLLSNAQRVTSPRLEILRILRISKNPLTIAEIHSEIKSKIDLATVYRTISLFEKINILHAINFGDEFKRYELICDRCHHHHIVCRKCKKVENIDLCLLEEVEKILRDKGYTEITHSLEFFGLCKDCK